METKDQDSRITAGVYTRVTVTAQADGLNDRGGNYGGR